MKSLSFAIAVFVLMLRVAEAGFPSRSDIAAPESVGMSPIELGRITSHLGDHVNDGKIAGTVILIDRYGRIAHLKAVGISDIESVSPIATDALFRIASMTKVATAVAAPRPHEADKFALDDDASRIRCE